MTEQERLASAGQVDRPVRPVCYVGAAVVAKLKAKAPEKAPHYGATTTVTIAQAFADDAALYDQAALDAAVAAERERLCGYFRAALADHGVIWPGEIDMLHDKCCGPSVGDQPPTVQARWFDLKA